MNILGIETSCDETSAAVVRGGTVLSSIIDSQVELHRPYGGVVPEIASRNHVEALPAVLHAAVSEAGMGWHDIDAVAATYGPGLASSLLVGLSAGKGLAVRLGKPFFAINHLEAHMFSSCMAVGAPRFADACPFLSLVVSGGHTCLLRVKGLGNYELLGQTIDDAAGEAFDKGAKLLDLGYPGGPVIDRLAKEGDPAYVAFPRGRPRENSMGVGKLDPGLCFSFSGLKTALLYHLKDHPVSAERSEVPSLAASYQEAIVDALVERCDRALGDEPYLAAGGGVSLNSRLRARLRKLAERRGVTLLLAEPSHCGDNAAMIAGLAAAGGGLSGDEAIVVDAQPSLPIVA